MRALLIESSRFHRQTTGSILQSAGFKVDYHETADEALINPSVRTAYSLVCLDLLSNEMNNIDVCRRIRKLPGYTQIPIVLITSKQDQRLTGEGSDQRLDPRVAEILAGEFLVHARRLLVEDHPRHDRRADHRHGQREVASRMCG